MGLVTNISQIRDHVNIDSSLQLPTLQPHVNFVERYFKKILGTAQYLALNTAIASESTSQEQDALLAEIYPSLSRLAVATYVVSGGLSISSQGVRRVEDSNEKTAYKYQEDAMIKRLTLEGFELIDDVLEFLEENEDDYAAWKNDTIAYTKFKQLFINTTTEFEEQYSIGGSRLTFRAMFPLLKHADYMSMRPILGSNFYDELKTQIKERNISEENANLLSEYIRPAVAHMVIAEAMDTLAVQISESGVRVVEIMQSFPSDVLEKNAPESVRTAKKSAASQRAQEYLGKLVGELQENASATKYATYFAQIGSPESAEGHNGIITNGIYRS